VGGRHVRRRGRRLRISREKPSPDSEDIAAVAAWGDIDLADELKAQRFDRDDETYATAEAALEAYVDAFAELYGGRDAVDALDSVGGALCNM